MWRWAWYARWSGSQMPFRRPSSILEVIPALVRIYFKVRNQNSKLHLVRDCSEGGFIFPSPIYLIGLLDLAKVHPNLPSLHPYGTDGRYPEQQRCKSN